MKYNSLCFKISGGHIIVFTKHDYYDLTSFIKKNKKYKCWYWYQASSITLISKEGRLSFQC